MVYEVASAEGLCSQNGIKKMKIAAVSKMKALAAIFVGVPLVAGGAGYLVKDKQGEPVIQSLFGQMVPGLKGTGAVGEQPKADEQIASLETPKTEAPTPAMEVPADPMAPTFSVLRVEPDGSVVIAGTAPSASNVEIVAAGEVLASAKAADNGDFAIVFDTPLAPGAHELGIRATLADGKTVLSEELGIVNIPADGGEVLAMVQKDGEATRVLQKPEAPAVETVAVTTEQPATETTTQVASAEAPKAPETSEPVAPAMKDVAVQAVDVEDNKMFVAGTGEPGAKVSVYVNNVYKGTTKVGPEGAFLFTLNEGLASGAYDLRVDMLAADSSEVASRAAVVVNHDAPPAPEPTVVASAEPAKAPEPVVEPETVAEAGKVEEQAEQVAATEPQKAVIETGRSVIIRSGDSLWKISRRMLGEGRRYTMIFTANTDQIKDPNRIYPGQVFDIPDEPSDG
jgi:nucleoid-associated protein YgaU